MLTKRTQILFDEYLWKTLFDIAKRENTSIGELVRTAVKEKYKEENLLQRRKKVVEEIIALGEKYGKELGKGQDSTVIIRKMREERYGQKHLRRLGSY